MTFTGFQYKRTVMGAVAVMCVALSLPRAFAEQWDDKFYQPFPPGNRTVEEPSYSEEIFDTTYKRVILGPWAAELQVGPEMKGGNIHLRGTRFYGQTLTKANFAGCDLTSVRFRQCDLSKASFRGAYLTGASIEECNITDTDFTDATVNGLRGDILSEKQFKSTRSYKIRDFDRCKIYSNIVEKEDGSFVEGEPPTYDFRDSSLRGAILRGDFRRCDFTNTGISGSSFEDVRITAKQLASTANYKTRSIEKALLHLNIEEKAFDVSGMKITDTTLSCPDCDVTLKDAMIERCLFHFRANKQQMYSTKSYQQGRLLEMTWHDMDMSTGWDFSRQNLTGAGFAKCDLTDARFEDAIITNSNFVACKGLTAEQIKSTWNYKNGRMAGIVLPEKIADALLKEKELKKQK